MTTAGKPTPTGTLAWMRTSVWIFLICRAIEAMTAAGADQDGGRHAVTQADQLAGVEVDSHRLHAGPADVHPMATLRPVASTTSRGCSSAALSWSSATVCFASDFASLAMTAVRFGSGASSRHGLETQGDSFRQTISTGLRVGL